LEALIAPMATKAQAYVCGPMGLLQTMQKTWEVSGRAAEDLRFETFGAASVDAESFKVCMPRHHLEFEVDPSTSLLDAMELEGIQAMYGCRKGECGLCVLPVLKLEGEIQHNDIFLSQHEKRSNQQICVCVSRVRGRITLDSAYRPETEHLMVSTLTA
jgi:vanillate O-demethylase ferredoxin subunit